MVRRAARAADGSGPAAWVATARLASASRGALVATGLVLAALSIVDRRLATPSSPLGVVTLQGVADADRAAAVVAAWGPGGRAVAGFALGLDLLLAMLYALLVGLAARRVALRAGRLPPRWDAALRGASLAALAAATLDVVEDLSALATVAGDVRPVWAGMTVTAAAGKWALLAAALATLAVAAVRVRRAPADRPSPRGR